MSEEQSGMTLRFKRMKDEVTLKRALIGLLMSMPISGPAVWKTAEVALETRDQWIEMREEVPKLKAEIEALKAQKEAVALHDRRLDKIERWKCVIGWNPHEEPRDRDRVCTAE